MNAEDLKKILYSHAAWLRGENKGIRANLSYADLSSAILSSANLRSAYLHSAYLHSAYLHSADLRSADLSSANLSSANLHSANLRSANLRSANLSYADLHSADLRSADLSCADLSYANLSYADLSYADLSYANLRCANISSANLSSADLSYAKNSELAQAMTVIVPQGDLVGWKKCMNGIIVRLKIPYSAKRSNASGRKCRAEFVEVLEVIGATEAISCHDNQIIYRVGEIIYPDRWNDNRWIECSNGIHFFITREEAEQYGD